MAVQVSRAVIAFEPALDKAGAVGRIARLEETMGALVSRVGIARVPRELTLDHPGTGRNRTRFYMGPAEIAEKPPVVAPMRRQFLEQRQLRLVLVAAPAEA